LFRATWPETIGAFYADLFVSCAAEDRTGGAAHFPSLVVEVLSAHVGTEFTRKKEAYLGSARVVEYLIIDSTHRYVFRYALLPHGSTARLVTAEYRRGPVPVSTLGLTVAFDQIYAGTSVPAILHPIRSEGEQAYEVILD
jgi:Uma2 family endonuclease